MRGSILVDGRFDVIYERINEVSLFLCPVDIIPLRELNRVLAFILQSMSSCCIVRRTYKAGSQPYPTPIASFEPGTADYPRSQQTVSNVKFDPYNTDIGFRFSMSPLWRAVNERSIWFPKPSSNPMVLSVP
jgi:hypothetical protein